MYLYILYVWVSDYKVGPLGQEFRPIRQLFFSQISIEWPRWFKDVTEWVPHGGNESASVFYHEENICENFLRTINHAGANFKSSFKIETFLLRPSRILLDGRQIN